MSSLNYSRVPAIIMIPVLPYCQLSIILVMLTARPDTLSYRCKKGGYTYLWLSNRKR